MDTNNQVALFNDLITKAYDAEIGYKECAEKANDPQLKKIFLENAQQRYDFGHDLKAEIKKINGEIEKGSSFAASVHRTWIDLKTALASNEDRAMLNEIINGEEYALGTYEKSLEQLPITHGAYQVLVNHRNAIRTSIDRMKNLEVIVSAE